LVTDALSKLNTVRLPWQSAGNNLFANDNEHHRVNLVGQRLDSVERRLALIDYWTDEIQQKRRDLSR